MHNSSLFTTKGLYFINFLAHNSSHHQMLHKVRIFTRLKWDDSIRLICWTLSCRCVQLYLCNLFRQREKSQTRATYMSPFSRHLSNILETKKPLGQYFKTTKLIFHVTFLKFTTFHAFYKQSPMIDSISKQKSLFSI